METEARSVSSRLEDEKFLLWFWASLLYWIPMYFHGYAGEPWVYIYPACYGGILLLIQVHKKQWQPRWEAAKRKQEWDDYYESIGEEYGDDE